MRVDRLKEEILKVIEKPMTDDGCELVELVVSQYKANTTLRLFVYTDNGTSVGECARISRLVGNLLEETDMLKSGYMLEVSSPGLDRPLKTARDFKFRVGETVKIDFVEPKRKNLKAQIISVIDETIEFEIDSEKITLNLSEIEQARIVF